MKNEAIRRAKRVLRETSATVPVDVNAIAAFYGVRVEYPDLEDTVSGMLVRKNGQAVIGVNASHANTRQRFTIAHELGHYLLHEGSGRIFVDEKRVLFRNSQSSTGTSLLEIEANAFAAALLMPTDEVNRYAEEMVENETDADVAVWSLASTFQVSEEAMRRRLSDLGYEVE